MLEEMERVKQNLELYEEYVEDPKAVLDSTKEEKEANGEELETEVASLNASLVTSAMSRRNLTPAEQQREEERLEAQKAEEADVENAQQWSILQVLVAVFAGVILLLLTISLLKKGGGDEDGFEPDSD